MDQTESELHSDDVEYVSRIHLRYSSLSRSHKRIANYILQHPDSAAVDSITRLAKKTGTTPATISRFCQALSYRGFGEFRIYMKRSILAQGHDRELITADDVLPVVMQKIAAHAQGCISDTVRTLDLNLVRRVADAIARAGNVFFFAQSGGYISSQYGVQMLLRAGVPAQAFNDPADMGIAARMLKKDDVAIGIAYSGEAKSALHALTIAGRNRAFVVSITAVPSSSMARASDCPLFYSHDIPDDLQYLYLGSMCEILVLGAIQTELMRRPDQREKILSVRDAVVESRAR